MDDIELFDKYIDMSLSDKERNEFEARLETDKAFKEDFLVYLAVADGVCREAEQDDADFGHALKNISDDQLWEIMGPRRRAHLKVAALKPKARPWVTWAVGVAAMVVVVFGAGWGFMRHVDNRFMDNIYAVYIDEIPTTSRGGEEVDLTEMDDKQLKGYLPQLEEEYAESARVEQENILTGLRLSMAYIRLHMKAKAMKILEKLADDYPDKPVGRQAKTMLRQLDR